MGPKCKDWLLVGLQRWLGGQGRLLFLQRGLEFSSNHPCQTAPKRLCRQLQGDPAPSSGLQGHCTQVHIHRHKYWCLLKKSEFRSLISIQLIHVDYSTPPLDYQSCVTSFRIGKCEFSRPFFPLQYWRALPALFCSMWTLGAFCEVWKIDTKYLLRVFCHLWVLALNHRIEEIINTKHRRINQPE